MSTALTTPAATTDPEARERSDRRDDGGTGARRRPRPRVLDRPGARAVVGLAVPAVLLVLWGPRSGCRGGRTRCSPR